MYQLRRAGGCQQPKSHHPTMHSAADWLSTA
jgi:hypothetical protein